VPVAAALSGFLAVGVACAQELTAAQREEFVRQAQPRYYSPVEHGFVSMTCDLKLDWGTVPKLMLAPPALAGRGRLESTKLRFTMRSDGNSSVAHEYANDTPALIKPVYDKFFEWTSNVVTGFFTTWGSKAMRTPIPDVRHIMSLTADQNSYLLKFDSGMPIEVTLSKDYTITRILSKSPAQTIDEHTQYSPSPRGLLLTGVDAISTASGGATHVTYDLSYQTIDTLEFPQNIHLVVDDNINMKFGLENCAPVHATVIEVAPPQ
jgi:hypothetical protein